MKHVVSQGSEESAPKISNDDTTKHWDQFKLVYGRDPRPEEECTADQLTCVDTSNTGLPLHVGGVLRNAEMSRSPRCQCLFRVLQFAVDCGGRFLCSRLGPMLDYSRLILEYASRHGTLTWPLLYQCDVRCQLEHVERLRRVLERNHALSKRQAPAIPFDLNWPWDSVWDDQSFWHRQFGEPAQGGTLDRCRYRRSTNPK